MILTRNFVFIILSVKIYLLFINIILARKIKNMCHLYGRRVVVFAFFKLLIETVADSINKIVEKTKIKYNF